MFDRLNKPAIEKWRETRAKKSASPKKRNRKETPAEIKARKKAADDRLAKLVKDWVITFHRCCLVSQTSADDSIIFDTVPWMLSELGSDASRWVTAAIASLGGKVPKDGRYEFLRGAALLERTLEYDHEATLVRIWRVICYPSLLILEDGSQTDRLADGVPEKLPLANDVWGKQWMSLAEAADVDVSAGWEVGGLFENAENQLIRKYFGYHTTEQLVVLCKRLKHEPCGSRKTEIVEGLMAAHSAKRLQLPNV